MTEPTTERKRRKRTRSAGKAMEPTGSHLPAARDLASDQVAVKLAGRSIARAMADQALSPTTRNAHLAASLAAGSFAGPPAAATESSTYVGERCADVRDGNLDALTDTLVAQMVTLDALFTDTLRRAANNLSQYPAAADRFMNMALKAQANCRTTAETVARIKRDGKQTVKVVHVHEGGQAVVADTINSGQREGVPHGNFDQCHRQAAHACVEALRSADPARD